MTEELSDEAIAVAYELSQSPSLDGVWRDDFAASWDEEDDGQDTSRDAITVYKIVGVDRCPGAGQATLHGRHRGTLSVETIREMVEPRDSTGNTAVDAA